MSREVKRYCLSEFAEPHTYPIGPGAHVLASDYETLKAERDALLAERNRLCEALKAIDEADWSSSESASDNEISMAKGTLIRQMKRIASAALQGGQP